MTASFSPSETRRPAMYRGWRLVPTFLALVASLSLASCLSAPARTIPDPLPETLAWAVPEVSSTAFLGLEVRENDSGSLESLSFDPGVRVHAIVERSPAAGAGIEVDDVLLSVGDVTIAVPDDLDAVLGSADGGERVKLGLQRGDSVFDVEVTLGGASADQAPKVREAYVLDPARSLAAWGTNQGAVLVAHGKKSPVRKLDIGTRVTALNGSPIVSGRGLIQRLVAREPGTRVRLTVVEPGEDPRDLKVTLLSEGRRTTRFSVPVLMTYDAPADGSMTNFVLLDLYLISLLRYERDGNEKRWRLLRFFQWSSGVGELDE